MKKTYLSLAAVGLLCASNAFAVLNVTVEENAAYRSAPGGEYTIYTSDASLLSGYAAAAKFTNPSGATGFESFCIERNENIAPNVPYTGTLSTGAVNGGEGYFGAGSSSTFDPISIGTSYLYSKFASGTLAGYNYTPGAGRQASARLLQDAIWFLESENRPQGGTGNMFYDLVFGLFGASVINNAVGGSVVVLNLVDAQGNLIQSQLVNVPEPSTVVAGALLLLPFGVSTLRILRKKQVS